VPVRTNAVSIVFLFEFIIMTLPVKNNVQR
jgi:hypothetical protein